MHTVRVRKLLMIFLISALLVGTLVMYVWPSAPPMNTPEHWLDRALRNSLAIGDRRTLFSVTLKCSQIGDKKRALKGLRAYMSDSRLTKFIDGVLVRIGLRQGARAKDKKINWYDVGKVQLEMGDLAEAERSTSALRKSVHQIEPYSRIALAYAQAGDDAGFESTIALAIGAAQGVQNRDYWVHKHIYTAYIRAGKLDKAVAVAQAQPDKYKAWEYALLARSLNSEKDVPASRKYAAVALSLIDKVEEGGRHKLNTYVIYTIIKNGDLAEANTLIESIPDRTIRANCYGCLGIYQAETGDFAGAYQTISRVTRDWSRSGAFWQVAYRLKEYPGKYEEFIDRFLTQVDQITRPGMRAHVRIDFARYACLPHNDRIRFRRCIDQALAEAEKAGTDGSLEPSKVDLYRDVAIALARAGESRQAKALVESFPADRQGVIISYIAIARAEAGDLAEAAELFHSVHGSLKTHNSMSYHTAERIAYVCAKAGRLKELDAWIRTLKPIMRAPACLGVARGLIIRQKKRDDAAKTSGH